MALTFDLTLAAKKLLAATALGSVTILASCAYAEKDGQHQYEAGRATSHRSFADVAKWSSVFDDPKRAEWQKPAEMVAALNLKRGQTVADLGAGTGYFLRHLCNAIGDHGTVFAVDVEASLVAHLRTRADQEELEQVVPVLASFDRPRLPPGRTDLVLIVDTFHHLDHRPHYLEKLKQALTPLGRVAIVDWLKKPLPEGPPPDHKIERSKVVTEMTAAGFELVDSPDILPYQYFLIFRKAEARTWGATGGGLQGQH